MLRRTHGAAPALVVIGTLAAVLGIVEPGCSDRACFLWKNSQGVCPDAQGATKFFGACSNIETVDSRGSFEEGQLCCYNVTRSLSDLPCQPMQPPHSNGPHSSEFSSARSVVGSGSVSTVNTGVGGGMSTGFGGFGGFGGAGGSGGAPACDQLSACGFSSLQEGLSGCLTCASANDCSTEADACNGAMSCGDFEACLGTCSIHDAACIDACKVQEPAGAMIFGDLVDCLVCIGCPTACASNPVQLLATCPGGAGGAGGTSTP